MSVEMKFSHLKHSWKSVFVKCFVRQFNSFFHVHGKESNLLFNKKRKNRTSRQFCVMGCGILKEKGLKGVELLGGVSYWSRCGLVGEKASLWR